MDEMTLLAQVRAELPGPSTDAVQEARARLTERATGAQVEVPRHRPRVRRRFAISLATAAAVAAGGIALTTGPGSHVSHAPNMSPAAKLLEGAAAQLLRLGDPKLEPGQFRDVRTHAWYGTDLVHRAANNTAENVFFMTEQSSDTWIPANVHDRWYIRDVRPTDSRFFSAADRTWIRTNHPDLLKTHVDSYSALDGQFGDYAPIPPGWTNPTVSWLNALPRDPDALLARVRADTEAAVVAGEGPGSTQDIDATVFEWISGVLSGGLASTDLQAALYRVAAKLPGIKLIDSEANLDGRHGVAIGRLNARGTARDDIIFDPSKAQFIGERTVVVRAGGEWGHAPVGTVVASTALTVTVVDGSRVPSNR